MSEIPINKKKRYLLLFNRVLRRELKLVLIKTPSKLQEDDINKFFNAMFIKKTDENGDYYVPRETTVDLKIDEEEFKNLYKRKPLKKPEPKPEPAPKKPEPKPEPKKETLKDTTNQELIRIIDLHYNCRSFYANPNALSYNIKQKKEEAKELNQLQLRFNFTDIKEVKKEIESRFKPDDKINNWVIYEDGFLNDYDEYFKNCFSKNYKPLDKYLTNLIKKEEPEPEPEPEPKKPEPKKPEPKPEPKKPEPKKPEPKPAPKKPEPKKPEPKPEPKKPEPKPEPKKPEPKQPDIVKEGKEDLNDALKFVELHNSNQPAMSFLRTNLGNKLYFYYILEKHKNDCLSINAGRGTDAIEWRYKGNQFTTNYSDKVNENDFIEKDIERCIKAKKRFLAIPITISANGGYHQNMIILDLVNMTAERFEPHGGETGGRLESLSGRLNKILQKKFEKEITINNKHFKYIPPSELCPRFTKDTIKKLNEENDLLNRLEGKQVGYQSFENQTRSGDLGYCVAWSLFYLDSRLSAPSYTPQEIYKHMFNKFEANPLNFLKFIRGYAEFLGEFYNKFYDDFIVKNPQFKSIKLLLYQGNNKGIARQANEIFKSVPREKYTEIKLAFNKFIDDLLISVSGQGTMAGSGKKSYYKKKGGMCPCLKK